MSEETPSIGAETHPLKIGDWKANARVWINVGCNLESAEVDGFRVLKVTPLSDMINFTIWKHAAMYEANRL
jgi:hypothetical protein